jgi:hypothetical protein
MNVNRNPTISELRRFGWATLGGFAVLGALLWYLAVKPEGAWRPAAWGWTGAGKQVAALLLWGLGLAMLLVCGMAPAAARRVYVGWMTGAVCIGTVVTTIVLSILFVVLLPVFSLIRFADPLRLKRKPPGESYWEDHRHHESTLERTIRPF